MKGWASMRVAGLAVASSLMMAGCAVDKAPERFYTLLPAQRSAAAAVPAPIYIDMLPVAVPAQVDRPQWVIRQADDTLRVLEQERWAGPLPDELRGAIVERLSRQWGAVDVRAVAPPAAPVWRVRVDVQGFDSVPGREARIEGTWSISSGQARSMPALVCRSVLREPVDGSGMPALADAHRRAVIRLADEIGQRLRAMQAGAATSCSGSDGSESQ